MPSPFSSSHLWKRQIQRVTTTGAATTGPVQIVLAASLLRKRPGEMKKLLTGARKSSNPITPDLLARTANRYHRHAPVIAEVARCLRDQRLVPAALETLRTHHASCTDPAPLLDPWQGLVRNADKPSRDDFRALQQALERALRDAGEAPEKQRPLCQSWIEHRAYFPDHATVRPQIEAFLASELPASLAPVDRDLLTYALSRPGSTSVDTRNPDEDLSAAPAGAPLLLVCASRATLTALQPVVDQLGETGRQVRTFSLDCLTCGLPGHATARRRKEPTYAFLGDQRLTSLRLLAALLTSHPRVAAPPADPALDFLDGLPTSLRPQHIYTTA